MVLALQTVLPKAPRRNVPVVPWWGWKERPDPPSLAYTSRCRRQGRRPALAVDLTLRKHWQIIWVAPDCTLCPVPGRQGGSLDAVRWAGAHGFSVYWVSFVDARRWAEGHPLKRRATATGFGLFPLRR